MLDFGLTDDQSLFRRTVADFLGREYPLPKVREDEHSPNGFDRSLYSRMADLGWTGLLIPQQYGGQESDWTTAALFSEEMGRALCLSPHFPSVIVGGQALQRWGSESLRREWLPRIASGERILTWAVRAPASALPLRVLADGDGHRVNGVCPVVPLGHAADACIVPATQQGQDALCLVHLEKPGVESTPLPTLGGLRLAAVHFHDAPAIILTSGASTGKDWETLLLRCGVLLAAEMLGGARASLDMAVAYAKERRAFGRPIGAFQALQHKMANMALAVEGAQVAVYYAAALLSQGKPALAGAAVALLQAARAFRLAATEGVQVFGGIGVMDESPISLYFRRAKALELLLGPTGALERFIADDLTDPERLADAVTLLR